MPNLAATTSALRSAIAGASIPGTPPIIYDNAPGTSPDGASWILFEVTITDSRNAQFGDEKLIRHVGIASASIFVPIDTGTAIAEGIAAAIVPVFRNVTISGVRCYVPTVRRAGQFEEAWWRLNVIVPFESDETA